MADRQRQPGAALIVITIAALIALALTLSQGFQAP